MMKFALVALSLCSPLVCIAVQIAGEVISVSDGDTITVLDSHNMQHKIRLSGIDAPEKKQPFGQRSKESLSDLVFSKSVTVNTAKEDRYGRKVGKVLVDGVDANLEQINRGMAWHYKAYAHEQSAIDRKSYSDAEDAAKVTKQGLWFDTEPAAPWQFRHNK